MQYLVHCDNQFLEHHGVLGMKWGHRKDRKSTKKKIPSAKEMTTKDLETRVKRYRLEQQYKSYTSPKSEKAKQITQKLLIGAGGAVVGVAVRESAKVGMSMVKRYLSSSAASKTAETVWDLM